MDNHGLWSFLGSALTYVSSILAVRREIADWINGPGSDSMETEKFHRFRRILAVFLAIAATLALGLGFWYVYHPPVKTQAQTAPAPAPVPAPANPAGDRAKPKANRKAPKGKPKDEGTTAIQDGIGNTQTVQGGTGNQQTVTGAGGLTQTMTDSPGGAQAGRDLTINQYGKPDRVLTKKQKQILQKAFCALPDYDLKHFYTSFLSAYSDAGQYIDQFDSILKVCGKSSGGGMSEIGPQWKGIAVIYVIGDKQGYLFAKALNDSLNNAGITSTLVPKNSDEFTVQLIIGGPE